MSSPDKHKPLSTENFFKLLDTLSDNSTDFEGMDDFEKEALEGFSAHTTPKKAKLLTEELNTAISKKIETDGKGGTKNKIIWFSAAASSVLIIFVSIFFFSQSKQDSENNLALKEVTEENKPAPDLEINAPVETSIKSAEMSDFKADKVSESLKTQSEGPGKKPEEGINGGLVTESTIALAENKQVPAQPVAVSIDESKTRNEKDMGDLQQTSVVLIDKIESKKKEKNNVEQEKEQFANGYAASQNVNTTTATNEEADKFNYKLDEPNDSQRTQSLEKSVTEKSAKEKSGGDKNDAKSVSSTKTSPAPSAGSTSVENNNAYYVGSELAIKEFVTSYFKTKPTTKVIVGKFKISGTVDVKGTLNITSIIQINKEDCNCKEEIKEALNMMKKWNPTLQNGKAVSSSVEFILAF